MMSASDNATPHNSIDYDKQVRQTIPFYETMQRETVDVIRTVLPDVKCWLDTGCGTGYLAEIAHPYFPQTHFILADPSGPMLEQARVRLKKITGDRVTFLPPTRSEELINYKREIQPQVITAVLCHHYLERPQRSRATEACYQLLDRGGVFLTVENISLRAGQSNRSGLERWARFQLDQGRDKSTVEDHTRRFNTKYFPITINEHLELLERTGFRIVELFWLSHMQAGFYAIK
jgi:tRNA (cmo5U34)-methyltransferase